jgi:predicted GNAT family N-acyltransferase
MMNRIETYAKENGMNELILHAQLYVKDFYLNRGYRPIGDIFQEADIDHIKMTKLIK